MSEFFCMQLAELATDSIEVEGSNVKLIPVENFQNSLVKDAIEYHCRPPEKSKNFYIIISDSEDTSESLFVNAQIALVNDMTMETTELYNILKKFGSSCKQFIAWYGEEYKDLPIYHNIGEAIFEIERQLKEPIGEVYIHYHSVINGPAPSTAIPQ